MHILFVCTGNICRSPFAAALTFKLAKEAGLDDLTTSSVGTHAVLGYGCADEALDVAKSYGVELEEHEGTMLDAEHLRQADLVIVMAEEHRRAVELILLENDLPAATIRNLAEFNPYSPQHPYVPDPYGRGLRAYRAAYGFIELCVRTLVEDLVRLRRS